MTVYRCIGSKTRYGSDLCKVFVQKVKRKENGTQGIFEIAPNFKTGGGYYKSMSNETKIIIKDKEW